MGEWLDETLQLQRPFVLYKSPGDQYIHCLTESTEGTQRQGNFKYVFAPFRQHIPLLTIDNPEGFKVELASLSPSKSFDQQRLTKNNADKEKYTEGVLKIKDSITNGEVTKVVLSRTIELPLQRDPWSVFVRMLLENNDAYCYWWYHPESGNWMGATPEVLLETAHGKVHIMSLAGTLPANSAKKAAWSEKEREEQDLVTRYIVEILSSFGEGVTKQGPVTVQAGSVMHLKTLITAPKPENLHSLLEQLHPTPAVCGDPKQNAYELIRELEPHDREYYTGYLGIYSNETLIPTQLFVNLRCMKWSASEIIVYVGGGITSDSDADMEWQETIDKSRTLLDVLDITMD